MKSLRTLSIGYNSLTEKKNEYGNDNSKSFHILNVNHWNLLKLVNGVLVILEDNLN